jgi:lipoprotein-anchoring transpeptidase ErfK/SrfK
MSASSRPRRRSFFVFLVFAGALIATGTASANPFVLFDILKLPGGPEGVAQPADPADAPPSYLLQPGAMQPSSYQPSSYQPASLQPASSQSNIITYESEERGAPQPRFKRQVVDYATSEPAGTVIIDTPNTYLYYVLGNGKAIRYGIGVGRQGFTWSGTETISRKAEWPDWTPPDEMIRRQPYLPRFMAGGPQNPLGARAMYLGSSIYRIHGTNAPATIGGRVSSGCIRLVNEDVIDLYSRAKVGTKVVVLPIGGRRLAGGMSAVR